MSTPMDVNEDFVDMARGFYLVHRARGRGWRFAVSRCHEAIQSFGDCDDLFALRPRVRVDSEVQGLDRGGELGCLGKPFDRRLFERPQGIASMILSDTEVSTI
jgi:hypothetical protein